VDDTAHIYSHLTRKIGGVRRLEQRVALQTGVLHALTSAMVIGLVAVTIEAIGWFDTPERTAIFWTAIVAAGAASLWFLLPPLARLVGILRSPGDDQIAQRVGRGIPEIGDRLVNTLQLYRASVADSAGRGFSNELVNASIVADGEPLRAYDYSIVVERDDRRRALFLLLTSLVVGGLLLGGFVEPFRSALDRLVDHTTHYNIPAPFHLVIAPGDMKVVAGDSASIVVRAVGVPPQRVVLRTESESGALEEYELRRGSDGLYRQTLLSLRTTLNYRAHAGAVRSSEHRLTVVERPEVRSLHATVTGPAYARRAAIALPENLGDVSGLRGSSVSIRIEANVPLSSATIVQLLPRPTRVVAGSSAPVETGVDTVRLRMKVDAARASGSFRLLRDGEYYIDLVSVDSVRNQGSTRYRMSTSSDGYPSIVLVEPADDSVTIDKTMLLPTAVRISDDYGFSWLRIHYRLVASRYEEPWAAFKTTQLRIPGKDSPLDVPYIWDMTNMRMVPEDVVEFYFEVADNDVVAGPKRARTDTVVVRFPSLDEVLRNAEESGRQANQALEQVMRQASDARKEMEEVHRELMKQLAQNRSGDAGWQEKKKLENLIARHEQLQKKLEEIAEGLRQTAERLREAQAISPETLQKYQELQKLFENVQDQKLLQQMRELQQKVEQMTPEQMAEAMKNYRFNEEEFRQSIERTMNILKRMQTEQKVDEVIRRAEELERQQTELNTKSETASPDDKGMRDALAERQKDLANEAAKLRDEAKRLAEQMNEFAEEMPVDEMKEAQQGLENDNPSEQMKQSAEQMERGEMDQARERGEKARGATEKFRQKMQAIQKKMQENGQRQVMNALKKGVQDLLELSRQEEALRKQTDKTSPNSSQFRDLARQQSQIQEQLANLTDQLMNLGKKSFAVTPEMGRELGEALTQMDKATGELEARDGDAASQSEGNALGAMNRAAQQMGEMIAQMENGEGEGMGMGMGMNMSQRLQQMAAQQQMINEAMGQMMGQGQQGEQGQQGKQGDGEGEGEGSEQSGKEGNPNDPRLRRLKQQQEQVKKSIDELNREAREGGGTRKNMVGDLERAAREIDDVLRDMSSGQISSETQQRQDRILSRLLDAVRSQRERDFERERESRSGVDVSRPSPPALKLGDKDFDRLRRDLLRAREQGYSKDYEELIRRYLEGVGGIR